MPRSGGNDAGIPDSGRVHTLRMRRACFALLFLAAVVVGVRVGAFPQRDGGELGDALGMILINSLVTLWCVFDGRLRGKPIESVGAMVMFLAWPIAFPGYCFWSRGPRGLGLLVGLVALLVLAILIGGVAGVRWLED